MVSYTEWTEAVWERLDRDGIRDVGREVFQAITSAIARYWRENKERLLKAAFQEAVKIAGEVLQELIDRGVLSTR